MGVDLMCLWTKHLNGFNLLCIRLTAEVDGPRSKTHGLSKWNDGGGRGREIQGVTHRGEN